MVQLISKYIKLKIYITMEIGSFVFYLGAIHNNTIYIVYYD